MWTWALVYKQAAYRTTHIERPKRSMWAAHGVLEAPHAKKRRERRQPTRPHAHKRENAHRPSSAMPTGLADLLTATGANTAPAPCY